MGLWPYLPTPFNLAPKFPVAMSPGMTSSLSATWHHKESINKSGWAALMWTSIPQVSQLYILYPMEIERSFSFFVTNIAIQRPTSRVIS
ncbi:hypothetical protein PanWU01x14_174490 [Parasponia andersonii]|uniref:Uncharacterized protein n=1 Tax=Parasponia andersonii TaxID=3476 RepID=A0A2P5C8E6_PARAD|nr:hypothetical protein PanWU01x14_174490 [Parasponia andersonii]